MTRTKKIIRIMGAILAVLYAVMFVIYLDFFRLPEFRLADSCLLLFLAVLFVSSLGIIFLKEWARLCLMAFNAFMGFSFLLLSLIYPDRMEPFYVFINLGVILFLNQSQLRVYFVPDVQLARKSILVVDDDEGFLKTASRILLPKGYSVLTATTGEKGMQIAKLQKPDLIILDVILPGIKGREVCAILKDQDETRDIPVVFVTAKESPDDVAAEMAVGGGAHLTKPIDGKELLAAVKNCMRS